MVATGFARVDSLFAGEAAPIAAGDPDPDAVGVVQDLLRGHGVTNLPGILGASRGRYGQCTEQCVRTFQRTSGLPDTGAVDSPTLRALAQRPARDPRASRPYLTLVLDVQFAGLPRLMSITSEFEGAGRFAAFNANTDRAGLSFGLIQWAQRPGRLSELLQAFAARRRDAFVRVFGGGDEALADALLRHTARPSGGVNAATGVTTDPRFNLVAEPWAGRFAAAARDRDLQRVQVEAAVGAFDRSLAAIAQFTGGRVCSERGVAFLLDLANQHGDGGARGIFKKVQCPAMTEAELLAAMAKESVARVRAQFGEGAETRSTAERRRSFRTSPVLSDQPFTSA